MNSQEPSMPVKNACYRPAEQVRVELETARRPRESTLTTSWRNCSDSGLRALVMGRPTLLRDRFDHFCRAFHPGPFGIAPGAVVTPVGVRKVWDDVIVGE